MESHKENLFFFFFPADNRSEALNYGWFYFFKGGTFALLLKCTDQIDLLCRSPDFNRIAAGRKLSCFVQPSVEFHPVMVFLVCIRVIFSAVGRKLFARLFQKTSLYSSNSWWPDLIFPAMFCVGNSKGCEKKLGKQTNKQTHTFFLLLFCFACGSEWDLSLYFKWFVWVALRSRLSHQYITELSLIPEFTFLFYIFIHSDLFPFCSSILWGMREDGSSGRRDSLTDPWFILDFREMD